MLVEEKRGMMGSLKKFDQAEHNIYDPMARNAMIEYINSHPISKKGLRTIENPNKHGIDLVTLNEENEVTHAWELEVRHGNWQGEIPFPFREMNCIERKDYLWRKDPEFFRKIPFKVAKDVKVYYVQLNKTCTRIAIAKAETILEYPLKPWANRKASGEYVRQVPVTKLTQVVIKKAA